jgi:hypothetical protein
VITDAAYVRAATAAGATIGRPNCLWMANALDTLTIRRLAHSLEACDHITGLESLRSQATIWPTFGDQAERLWCVDCWVDPGAAAGCQCCQRRPAPGVRRIVSAPRLGPEQVVIVGQLCTYDRRRLT